MCQGPGLILGSRGCRQWGAHGVLSSDEANSDKHKMERFLHGGRHSMLSVMGPLAFGNLPLLAFHRDEDGALQLAATGAEPASEGAGLG